MATEYTHENRQLESAAVKQFVFNGDTVVDLLKGAAVVWYKFDGFDWHVLIRRTKTEYAASGWEYVQLQTMFNIDVMDLTTMTTRNGTMRAVIKKCDLEYQEDRAHKYRMCERAKEKENDLA